MASPMPVLPAVPSTIRPPGRSRPARSWSRTIHSAARSFTDCPGFMNSALPRISHPVASLARFRRMSGVSPMASRTLFAVVMGGYLRGGRADQKSPSGLGQRKLHHIGAFGAETGLAIAQVELPELAEPLVEAE